VHDQGTCSGTDGTSCGDSGPITPPKPNTRSDAALGHAFTDAIEPLLVLHGLTEGRDWRGEILSYEVPTYFGMLCATYAPR
jgi:hypothetical protein